MMNKYIEQLALAAGSTHKQSLGVYQFYGNELETFVALIVEETLRQVDERTYGRGENQWYYDDDKRWVRLHFGYGELSK